MKRLRTASCPPTGARSLMSGPWSLEWLSDQVHCEAGVISSSCKHIKKVGRPKEPLCKSNSFTQKRKKLNGVLRHSVHSLKKVARLSNNDREAVLQILKKNNRKFQGSDRLRKAV